MAGTVNHWEVLGLKPGADAIALKRAFRAQARRWHPDLNGNDPVAEERFKQVNEAYAVLSDPARRRAWEAGETDRDGEGQPDPFASGFPDFDTYLDQLFGGRRRDPAAGPDGQEPAFERDARGDGDVSSSVPPDPPPGPVTAAEPGRSPTQAIDVLETLLELTPEQALEGSQVELELPDGLVVVVWTPPLAGDGWRLRLAGVTPGGGDHFLQLRVVTADGLRVDGLRVLYTLDLSPAEAALGCRLVVPTLQGAVKLQVPAGSSSGRLLRLRGRGLARGGQRGDQLVELRIVVPDQLSEAEVALYRRLQELASEQQ